MGVDEKDVHIICIRLVDVALRIGVLGIRPEYDPTVVKPSCLDLRLNDVLLRILNQYVIPFVVPERFGNWNLSSNHSRNDNRLGQVALLVRLHDELVAELYIKTLSPKLTMP